MSVECEAINNYAQPEPIPFGAQAMFHFGVQFGDPAERVEGVIKYRDQFIVSTDAGVYVVKGTWDAMFTVQQIYT